MELTDICREWPGIGPWSLSPLAGGTNNQIWRAETADKQIYALRVMTDNSAIPHIHYEATILRALSEKQLPFLLAVPLKASDGEIIVPFTQESGTATFAILYPFLPGIFAERNDIRLASQAGLSLALLDRALAELPEFQAINNTHLRRTFGELGQCHPAVADPLTVMERLPIPGEQCKQIQRWLAAVMESVPRLYRELPQQLLHRDYDPSNILVENQRVTAVLDFEFAGIDIRVLDLCVALSWWPVHVLGTGKEWEIIDAFGSAYVGQCPLSAAELRALPEVFRLRDATSLIHRIGRYLNGQQTDTQIQGRIEHSLWREEWLAANEENLVQHTLSWR